MLATILLAVGAILMPINGGKTTRWTGAVDTAWTTAGNWTNGLPASNNTTGLADTVIINATAVRGILSATNRTTDDGGKGLRIYEFFVEPGCNVEIGTSAAPLQFTWATAIFQGNHHAYMCPAHGTVAQTTLRTIVHSSSADRAVWFKPPAGGVTQSLVVKLEVLGGLVHIQDAIVSELFMADVSNEQLTFPIVVLNGAASSDVEIPFFTQLGGRTLVKSGEVEQLLLTSGLFECSGPAHPAAAAVLRITGGTLRYNVVSGNAPAIVYVMYGALDLEQVTGMTLASVVTGPTALVKKGIGNTITETVLGAYPYP